MTTPAKAAPTAPSSRKFNVTEYYRMGEVGIFHPEERLELIDGVIMLRCPPAPLPEPRKFTVAEYYRLAEAGILAPDERVELIDGEIILMAPIGSRHGSCVAFLTEFFLSWAAGALTLWPQNTIHLEGAATLQPDIALLKRRSDFYTDANPGPADILLIIEVCDSSLAYDRNVKLALYGSAGIIEVWLVNLPDNCLEVYRDPVHQGYRQSFTLRRGDTVTPVALSDVTLDVADILPPELAYDTEDDQE